MHFLKLLFKPNFTFTSFLNNFSLNQSEAWLLPVIYYLQKIFEQVHFGNFLSSFLTKQYCLRDTSDYVWKCPLVRNL